MRRRILLPVLPEEVAGLHIEVSRLTAPFPLEYDSPEDLLRCLRALPDETIGRDLAECAEIISF